MGLELPLSRRTRQAEHREGRHPQCRWGKCFPGRRQRRVSCCTWWPPWHLSLLWVLCSDCAGNAEPCRPAGELPGLLHCFWPCVQVSQQWVPRGLQLCATTHWKRLAEMLEDPVPAGSQPRQRHGLSQAPYNMMCCFSLSAL